MDSMILPQVHLIALSSRGLPWFRLCCRGCAEQGLHPVLLPQDLSELSGPSPVLSETTSR